MRNHWKCRVWEIKQPANSMPCAKFHACNLNPAMMYQNHIQQSIHTDGMSQ